jgi:acyl transferase domain-containing protein
MINAAYWIRHIRETVQFNAGMHCLHRLGYKVYLEIGPKGTLIDMGKDCLNGEELTCLASTNPRESNQHLLQSLGELYIRGYDIDWQGYYQGKLHRKISLPTYPFQGKRFWVDSDEENEMHSIDPREQKNNVGRYEINWQPYPIVREDNKIRDRFVLFTDDEDKGLCFADALKKQGKDGMLIQHQQGSLQQKSAWQFTIDFSDVAQWQQLMSLFSNWNNTNIIFIYLCGLELSTVDESKIDYCQHVIYPGFLYLGLRVPRIFLLVFLL